MGSPADFRPAPGTIPTKPGVYRFRDSYGRVIYVGKAKNLRNRLNSYFVSPENVRSLSRRMLNQAASVEWTVVANEGEALQLEWTWIQHFHHVSTFSSEMINPILFWRFLRQRRSHVYGCIAEHGVKTWNILVLIQRSGHCVTLSTNSPKFFLSVRALRVFLIGIRHLADPVFLATSVNAVRLV